jgi:hypothetical protein
MGQSELACFVIPNKNSSSIQKEKIKVVATTLKMSLREFLKTQWLYLFHGFKVYFRH